MITGRQSDEMKQLAKQIGYKVICTRKEIRLLSKCTTDIVSNDEHGYKQVKEKLEGIFSRSKIASKSR